MFDAWPASQGRRKLIWINQKRECFDNAAAPTAQAFPFVVVDNDDLNLHIPSMVGIDKNKETIPNDCVHPATRPPPPVLIVALAPLLRLQARSRPGANELDPESNHFDQYSSRN